MVVGMDEVADLGPEPDRRSVVGLIEALPDLVELFEDDPMALGVGALGDAVRALTTLAGQVDAALCRCVDAFEQRGACGFDGAASTASWMAARTEFSKAAAADLVKRGSVLRACPLTMEAYRAGVLGTAKVRLLVKARDEVEDQYAEHEAELIDAIRDLSVARAAIVLKRWHELARSQGGPSEDAGPEPDGGRDNSLSIASTFEGRRVLTGSADRVGAPSSRTGSRPRSIGCSARAGSTPATG